ncbi:MAG: hypothetical protein EON93_22240 [Burkholderiales bacterium]|nr:MAG: hypothetical protein EON93_22240 [Burkholderiales bacterium]
MSPSVVERVKLTANLLNSVSSGTILASMVAPYIGMSLGTLPQNTSLWSILALSGFGVAFEIVLHLIARRHLGRLED